MKVSKLLSILAVVVVLAIGLTACPWDKVEPTETASPTAEPQTIVIVTPKPDVKATGDDLLGDWVEYRSPEDTDKTPRSSVKITKTAAGYQYKDQDAAYQGKFTDGELVLKDVTPGKDAKVYIDQKTKRMNMVFDKSTYVFEKK